MLTVEEKQKIIKKYKLHDLDTGSADRLADRGNQKVAFAFEKARQRFSFQKRVIANGGQKKKIPEVFEAREYQKI